MDYQDAVNYISDIPRFTTKNKPEHTKALLEKLKNPEKKLKVIHVAGTNGKGSVCAYLSALLISEGKTVGLFTSPHLVRVNERIRLNGQVISDERFLEVFETVLEAVKEMETEDLPHPTFFEFLFAMAVVSFAEEGMEYAILETGIGGRLDATSAVERPICCVITSIGRDHMDLLGDSLAEIAAEKAGILKDKVPLVFVESDPESDAVIVDRATALHVPYRMMEKDDYQIQRIGEKDIAFSWANAYDETRVWTLRNTGVYQPENAALALEVMRLLFGIRGDEEAWCKALGEVVWEGRMEEVRPGIFVDGAHNESAMEGFVKTIQSRPDREKSFTILFSALSDKDYEGMIKCLCENLDADRYVVTQIDHARGVDRHELARIFSDNTTKPVIVSDNVREAWQVVKDHQGDGKVYCLGSLYLVGEIKAIILEESI